MTLNVKVRQNGRIVIPQETREFYDIGEGDILEIEILKIKRQNGMVITLFPQPAEVNA